MIIIKPNILKAYFKGVTNISACRFSSKILVKMQLLKDMAGNAVNCRTAAKEVWQMMYQIDYE